MLNGFGKSIGLVQVNELGTLETPILLTNTFAVGTCATALIRRAVAIDPEIGRQTSTVNPVVLECNDGYLNDIQAPAITEAHADAAIEAASEEFAVGSVGAGTGMSCFGLKGGIGSASRRLRLEGTPRRFGAGEFRPRRRSAAARRKADRSTVTAVDRGRFMHRGDGHRHPVGSSSAHTRGAPCRCRTGMVRRVLGPWQRGHRAGLHHCEPRAAQRRSGPDRAARLGGEPH